MPLILSPKRAIYGILVHMVLTAFPSDFYPRLHGRGLPLVMGILNASPDSFWQPSRCQTSESVLENQVDAILAERPDLLDIGGESTRPGSSYIDASLEIDRILPVIHTIRKKSSIPISVDTRKAVVAQAALEAGANIINDISAFEDDESLTKLARDFSCPIVLMHKQGIPLTMQENPQYEDVVNEVFSYLIQRGNYLEKQGIRRENIIVDPGLGFGKSLAHNLAILQNLGDLCGGPYPVLLAHSRKGFIGALLDSPERPRPSEGRLSGGLGIVAHGYLAGVRMFRVHEPRPAQDVLRVLAHCQGELDV